MHELARELNDAIRGANPHIHEMLSRRGLELFFPKGILSQSAEAKKHAHKFNATIGMAKEDGHAMSLPSVMQSLPGFSPDEALPYAPGLGLPDLREAWQQKQLDDNPAQRDAVTTLPLVTGGLTHGLSVLGDLFINPGDALLVPDMLWGNYRLIFATRLGAELVTFNFFTPEGGFDQAAFETALGDLCAKRDKVVLLLNFPNNPAGYTPTEAEGRHLADAIIKAAEGGTNLVVICDDAYFGLTYTDDTMAESLFGLIAGAHERVLAVKADAATKEFYVWGFRTGFLTFGPAGVEAGSPLLEALEKKTAGAIRGCVSNCTRLSQEIILRALKSPDLAEERAAKYELMKARALEVKEALADAKYADAWEPYPFNSGYFMCIRLKDVDAETLRTHVLQEYGVGVIAIGDTDIRIAFSCLEVDQVAELFDLLHQAVQDLRG